MLIRITVLMLGAGVFVHSAQAQDVRSREARWEDSSARKIMAEYRNNPRAMVPILRQVGKAQPPAKLDEIVDSLAGRAAAGSGTEASLSALDALVAAGRRALEPNEGTPAPGVLDRLIRIDRELPRDASGRAGTLGRMLEMPEHTRALNYLLGVVTSESTVVGQSAMIDLLNEVNPKNMTPRATTPAEIAETNRALRALWDRYSAEPLPRSARGVVMMGEGIPSKVIPNADAVWVLEIYAEKNGWGGGRKP